MDALLTLWRWVYNPATFSQTLLEALERLGWPAWALTLAAAAIGMAGLLIVIVPSQLAALWLERKVLARMQVRYGPNRAGPAGLLQPLADALKILTKESITPAGVDRIVFGLAPVASFIPALLVWAVMPFGPGMVYTDLNIGALFLVAVSATTVIPIFMAGWSSNNKFALLGAMRAIAQSISYEIPMVLSLLGAVLLAGSLQMGQIVEDQIARGVWYALIQPLGFLIFFISATAELNRTPNDIMEAESEIIAGYHTEYSGMKFALFYLAEYTSMLALSGVVAGLFFGGWGGLPLLDRIVPPWLWFLGKLYLFLFVFIWLRGTLPRLRIDQLMDFAWKYLLPLSLANIFLVGAEVLFLEGIAANRTVASWLLALVNALLSVVLLVGWARLFRLPGISRPAKPAAPAPTVVLVSPERRS